MRKFFIFFRKNKKKIFQAVLFLLTIIIVTFLFPREGKFRYEYQKGKPWMHEDLYAYYDFPIYKSESRLNAERDSIIGDFNPYFRYDSSVVVLKMNDFLEAFDQKWTNFLFEHYNLVEGVETDRNYFRSLEETKNRYKSFTSDILEHLYLTGIVEVSDILERDIELKEIKGSSRLLKMLVDGNWDNDEVLRIKPGQKILQEYFFNN